MQLRSSSSMESNINVTPLVDVCLVLLVIFMIVIPTMVHGVPVQLPIAKGEPVPEALRQTVITVKADATIYIDNLVIRREQFAAEIQRIHTAFPQKPIAVRGDRSVTYGEVVDVLDTCRDAGYADVRLMSQRPR
jgi:biopolymer transport protein ExbD